MAETTNIFLQYGALGLVALIIIIAYKLIDHGIILWMENKSDRPPTPADDPYDYNRQHATLVYDNSKVMSEVAVSTKNSVEILKEVVRETQALIKVQEAHTQKANAFFDAYGDAIVKKLEGG